MSRSLFKDKEDGLFSHRFHCETRSKHGHLWVLRLGMQFT